MNVSHKRLDGKACRAMSRAVSAKAALFKSGSTERLVEPIFNIGGASVCGAARDKAEKKDTAYGCVLGVFERLPWRREGLILGFVDVPAGGHIPSLPSPRKTLAADAKTSLAFLASWR